MTLVPAATFLLGISLLATLLPARRAARVNLVKAISYRKPIRRSARSSSRTPEGELLDRLKVRSKADVRATVFPIIVGWYNPHRRQPLSQTTRLQPRMKMDTNRLEAFSDGVFAIAATLLVLEITVPSPGSALGRELLRLWPSYLAYAVSFIVIGAIWLNHHRMFDQIVRVDHTLLLLNAFHLMFIAFIPFPTAVLAGALHEKADQPLATAFYGATLTVIGVLVTAMWWHAAREHRFLDSAMSGNEAPRETRRFLVGPVGYGIATLVALIAPWVALTCFVALNVFFLWPRHGGFTDSAAT